MGLRPRPAGRAPHRGRAAACKMRGTPLLGGRAAGRGRMGGGAGAEHAGHRGVSVRHLPFQLSGRLLRFLAAGRRGRACPPCADLVRCGRRAGGGVPLSQLGAELRRSPQREQPAGHRLCVGGLSGDFRRYEALGRPHRAVRGIYDAAQLRAVHLPLFSAVGCRLRPRVLPALARRWGVFAVGGGSVRRRAGAVRGAAPHPGRAVLCVRHPKGEKPCFVTTLSRCAS